MGASRDGHPEVGCGESVTDAVPVIRRTRWSGPAESGRYLTVGAACAVANNLLLIGGAAAGLHYAVCFALTVVIVLPASYPAHACWTFGTAMSWGSFGRYLLGSLSAVVVAGLMMALLCGPLHLPMVIAAPATTAAMLVYNFLMTRWAVRRRVATPSLTHPFTQAGAAGERRDAAGEQLALPGPVGRDPGTREIAPGDQRDGAAGAQRGDLIR